MRRWRSEILGTKCNSSIVSMKHIRDPACALGHIAFSVSVGFVEH